MTQFKKQVLPNQLQGQDFCPNWSTCILASLDFIITRRHNNIDKILLFYIFFHLKKIQFFPDFFRSKIYVFCIFAGFFFNFLKIFQKFFLEIFLEFFFLEFFFSRIFSRIFLEFLVKISSLQLKKWLSYWARYERGHYSIQYYYNCN